MCGKKSLSESLVYMEDFRFDGTLVIFIKARGKLVNSHGGGENMKTGCEL